MRVVRIYHAGRDSAHRARERALVAAGAELTLVVPSAWPETDSLHDEPFEIVELRVRRAGDVNRHVYRRRRALAALIRRVRPDVVDLHEEPFSAVTHQVLRVLPADQVVVGYSAQNIDKRWPPPFHGWEQAALARWRGAYPCSRQAASVLRGRGFAGPIQVLPLAATPPLAAGPRMRHDILTLGVAGRLVPEKGVEDAVRALAQVRRTRPARLLVAGGGPSADRVRRLGLELDVPVEMLGQVEGTRLDHFYAQLDVLLVPSRSTRTWTEQFGRVVVEAAARRIAVVAYASGALPEVVASVGATVVPEGDVGRLAEAALRARPASVGPSWAAVADQQFELYERAIRGESAKPTGRAAARREFGPPAIVPGGGRPFALPLLRGDNALSRELAAMLDRRA